MKLSSRVLVAALALAAAGSASAQLTVPQNSSGTELLFYAYDPTIGTSFIEDLGTSFANFTPTSTAAGTSFVDGIASSAAWQSYVSNTLTTADNDGYGYTTGTQGTIWAVVAASSNSAGTGNTYGLEATENVNFTGSTKLTSPASNGMKGWINTPLTNLMNGINDVATATPLTGYYTNSGGQDNVAQTIKNGAGAAPFNFGNVVGATSVFNYYSVTAVNSFPTVYGNSAGNSTFTFDGTNLTYAVPSIAAVPEPSSYLMMLSGLLMVGALAVRRRNSK